MRQRKLLFLLLLLMAIPATMQAYTNNEIVKKDGLVYQVIDVASFKLSFVGAESTVTGTITVPGSFDDGKGTTFTVTKVGGNDNYSCTNITKITLPDGIMEIAYGSFGGASLSEVNIPASVTTISHTAFYRVRSLPKFTVGSGSTMFASHISLFFPYSKELWCKENKDLRQLVAEVKEKIIINRIFAKFLHAELQIIMELV